MKRLWLGSGGFFSNENSRRRLLAGADQFFGSAQNLALVPYAQIETAKLKSWVSEARRFGDRKLTYLDEVSDPVRVIDSCEGVVVFGGNTFVLLDQLYRRKLVEPIRRRVAAGLPYLGMSAGTNVACPTIRTTNDMPIVAPPSLDALGLVPFQINPHYIWGKVLFRNPAGELSTYAGETRDDRIAEFLQVNPGPVLGLPEATVLLVSGESIAYDDLGTGHAARVFRRGKEFEDFGPGSNASGLSLALGLGSGAGGP